LSCWRTGVLARKTIFTARTLALDGALATARGGLR
jgi:hypothetical protein